MGQKKIPILGNHHSFPLKLTAIQRTNSRLSSLLYCISKHNMLFLHFEDIPNRTSFILPAFQCSTNMSCHTQSSQYQSNNILIDAINSLRSLLASSSSRHQHHNVNDKSFQMNNRCVCWLNKTRCYCRRMQEKENRKK